MKGRSYTIRSIEPGDLQYLADHLREADKAELEAASGNRDFLSRLSMSVDLSEQVQVVEADDVPVLLFGIAAMNDDTKAIWCVGTETMIRFRRALVEDADKIIAGWFEVHPMVQRLVNVTYTQNQAHHAWLRMLGAVIHPAEPMGPQGALFHPFEIKRETYDV